MILLTECVNEEAAEVDLAMEREKDEEFSLKHEFEVSMGNPYEQSGRYRNI